MQADGYARVAEHYRLYQRTGEAHRRPTVGARTAGKPVSVADGGTSSDYCGGARGEEVAPSREENCDRTGWRSLAGAAPDDRRTSPLEEARRDRKSTRLNSSHV